MRLRINVTFKVSLSFDKSFHPIGEEVATYLATAFETRSGMRASIEDWRDCGYELDFQINGKELHFAFAYVEGQPYQFYGQVASYVGWARRLLGYRDNEEESKLIQVLNEILKNDPTFTEVFWHDGPYDEDRKSLSP